MQIEIDMIAYKALDKTNEYNNHTTDTLPKQHMKIHFLFMAFHKLPGSMQMYLIIVSN